jgi:uncharacterized NAD(P)/FAD-binding protein YdhS
VVALLRATTWLRLRYRLVLVDAHGRHARGTGYAPGDHRPLDAPVKGMSVLPDQPCHLMDWARTGGLACGPETLLPRRVYGDYLAQTLAATVGWAAPHAGLEARTGRVVRAEQRDGASVAVHLADGAVVEAAALIVATGDPRTAPPPEIPGIADPGAAAGLATCRRGALLTPEGGVSRRLFAVGPVRRGHAAATIPDIRAQTERLAERIADTVLRDRPVTA